MQLLLVVALAALLSSVTAFRASTGTWRRFTPELAAGPRPLHDKFTVEKGTPDLLNELGVSSWPTWTTAGSTKYQTGVKSPLKIYDCNELSYITKGSMEITDADTGITALVETGDFVTFPLGFRCYWLVKQTVTKSWYLY